jgi:chromate transporter
LLQHELVERRHWLGPDDVRDALAFTKPLPGSTVVQVVAFLGWRMRGRAGAIVATAAFLLPSVVLMTLAAAGTALLPDAAWVRGALAGVRVAVVGLLASALLKLARTEAKGLGLTLVLAVAFVLGFVAPAALVVIGAGALGALVPANGKEVLDA